MEEFTFGDILKGERTNHPIIFLKQRDNEQFYGCIITHSKKFKNNIPFLEEHFETINTNGNRYKVTYDNSYFTKLKLIKKNEWGPYEKVGMLTQDGKASIQNQIKMEKPTTWENYIDNLKSEWKEKRVRK